MSLGDPTAGCTSSSPSDLLPEKSAVPSAPGAAGIRVWEVMSWGRGPRTGRPRRRRLFMLLTVSRLGGPPQLLYSSSMVWANSGSGAMLDLHTHIVPPRWEDFGWARRGVGVREDALSACRHFRRQSAPRARSLTAPRAPVHYSSRWPGPTRPRTSVPGPRRADRAFVYPKRSGHQGRAGGCPSAGEDPPVSHLQRQGGLP